MWHLGEGPKGWRIANVTTIFRKEDPGSYRLVGLTLILGKVMEQLILETVLRPVKDKQIVGIASVDA